MPFPFPGIADQEAVAHVLGVRKVAPDGRDDRQPLAGLIGLRTVLAGSGFGLDETIGVNSARRSIREALIPHGRRSGVSIRFWPLCSESIAAASIPVVSKVRSTG